ncbi:MAG: hypothetical protein CMI96_04035 [Pelagibacteraceae bacterium]|nr:hypothetical protein [Pelagibacteraceae bacterium]|tara:strand:- start:38696 stop:39334 length:639 start_codon:yes stop_codon:yes gene_type:complete
MKNKIQDYDVIIFDFDGVIAKSNKFKTNVFLKCVNDRRKSIINKFSIYLKKNLNKTRKEKFVYFLKNIEMDYSLKKYNKLMKNFKYIMSKDYKKCKLIKGVKVFIKKNYTKRKLVIISSGSKEEIIKYLKYKKINQYFNIIYGNNNSKENNFKKIIKKFKNHYIISFGDTINDYRISKKFKIDFIHIKEDSNLKNFKLVKLKSIQNFSKFNI